MRLDPFERASGSAGAVRRLPAGLELALAIALVLGLVLLPRGSWGILAALAALLLALALAARLPLLALLRRLCLLEPLVVGVSLLALFQPDGAAVFAWLVARSTLSLATLLVFAATTPFEELLGVLERLRLPRILVTTLALLRRYLLLFVDEGQRLRRARQSRSFARTRWREWAALGSALGVLFVRASERAERIYAAMSARGWR